MCPRAQDTVKTSASYKYLRKSPCETLKGSLRAYFEAEHRFSGSAGNFAVFLASVVFFDWFSSELEQALVEWGEVAWCFWLRRIKVCWNQFSLLQSALHPQHLPKPFALSTKVFRTGAQLSFLRLIFRSQKKTLVLSGPEFTLSCCLLFSVKMSWR
jgi:hypothetical protein